MLTPGSRIAVDEDVVAGVEPADEEAIAKGVAAFAGSKSDARRASPNLAKAGGVLILEHFFCEHGDRPRRVQHGLGEFVR